MDDENIYKKSDLNLQELANELDVSTHHLSQVINQELGTNFFDFINQYRVDEAKRKLVHPDYRKLTFLAIAYESGFSSKSSFYRIFKKHTGVSPSSYVSKIKDRRQA